MAYSSGDIFLGMDGDTDTPFSTYAYNATGAFLHLAPDGSDIDVLTLPDEGRVETGGFAATIGQDGRLYVTYSGIFVRGVGQVSHNYLGVFEADGSWGGQLAEFGHDSTNYPSGLTIAPNGDLIVQFPNAPVDLRRLTTAGVEVNAWTTAGNGNGGFVTVGIPYLPGYRDVVVQFGYGASGPPSHFHPFNVNSGMDLTSYPRPSGIPPIYFWDAGVTGAVMLASPDLNSWEVDLLGTDFLPTITYPFYTIDFATQFPFGVRFTPNGQALWSAVNTSVAVGDDLVNEHVDLYRMDLTDGSFSIIRTFTGGSPGLDIPVRSQRRTRAQTMVMD